MPVPKTNNIILKILAGVAIMVIVGGIGVAATTWAVSDRNRLRVEAQEQRLVKLETALLQLTTTQADMKADVREIRLVQKQTSEDVKRVLERLHERGNPP